MNCDILKQEILLTFNILHKNTKAFFMKRILYIKMSILLGLSVLFISPLLSQTYKKGYIVTSSNDTLKGVIKEGTDTELLKKIFFSADERHLKIVTYETQQLKGFGFSNGRVFENFVLKEFNGRDTITTSYFAKRILTGKICAYIIELDQKGFECILINKETGNIVHLKEPKDQIEKQKDGKQGISKDYKYLHYLTAIKQDSPNMYIKQEDINYTKEEIINDIEKFDIQHSNKYPLHKYIEQKQISYTCLGGYSIYNQAKLSDIFKLSIYRDVTWIEKSLLFSIIQKVSYCQQGSVGNVPTNYQTLSILPAGFKIQPNTEVIKPYAYACFGVTYDFKQHRDIDKGSHGLIKKTVPLYLSLDSGIGVKIKLNTELYLIPELSYRFPLNGAFANIGIAYQFIN